MQRWVAPAPTADPRPLRGSPVALGAVGLRQGWHGAV